MLSMAELRSSGLPAAGQLASELSLPPKSSSSSASAARKAASAAGQEEEVDLERLLRIGPASENAERAANARATQGLKGDWARHAYEAMSIVSAGGYEGPEGWVEIRADVYASIVGSRHYGPTELPPPAPEAAEKFATETEVRNCTTLSAAQELAALGVPGVLNFASARNPGGGFLTGASAQEESLARSSALYPSLTRHFDSFFAPNRQAESGGYTHDMIFSPRVPVFRGDDGRLLPQAYLADFATAAAPNVGVLRRKGTAKEAEAAAAAALEERVPRVLEAFARNGSRDIVLGAWGCGVFGNDPRTVAQLFRRELSGRFAGSFRRVVFAVLDASMAAVFAEVLGKPMLPPTSEGSKWGAKRRWGGGGKKGHG